jgi:hypothetical protein
MDKITQQNAALVEQAAAAAKSMEDQTDGLAGMVSAFRVNAAAAPARTPLKPAPARVTGPTPAHGARKMVATASKSARADSDDWKEF